MNHWKVFIFAFVLGCTSTVYAELHVGPDFRQEYFSGVKSVLKWWPYIDLSNDASKAKMKSAEVSCSKWLKKKKKFLKKLNYKIVGTWDCVAVRNIKLGMLLDSSVEDPSLVGTIFFSR